MYQVTLTAESRAELTDKIRGLAVEWAILDEIAEIEAANDPKGDSDNGPIEPTARKTTAKKSRKAKANPNVGTADDQPDLPLPSEAPEETAPAPKEETPVAQAAEPEPEPAEEVTAPAEKVIEIEQLREQMMAYAQANGSVKAKQLVQEYGADKISEVTEDQRNALFVAAGGAL